MKTSTIIFNVAAVVTLIGLFIALADLMRHKAKSKPGVTLAPVTVVATLPPVAVAEVVTVAPAS